MDLCGKSRVSFTCEVVESVGGCLIPGISVFL